MDIKHKNRRFGMKTTVAVLDKCGGDAVGSVANVFKALNLQEDMILSLATPLKTSEDKSLKIFKAKKLSSSIAVGSAAPAASMNAPLLLKSEEASAVFDGRIYFPKAENLLVELLSGKSTQAELQKAASAFLNQSEGDFALTIAWKKGFVVARDPVGVQPLYFGENDKLAALSTNRKGLWKLGVEDVRSFPPGNVASVTSRGFKFKPIRVLDFREPKSIRMDDAVETLLKLLRQSMRLRLSGLKEVAVAFSGGLDSSLVACLAKETGINVQLFHVSLNNQPETAEAKKAADALGLPLKVHLFTESNVENVLPKVLEIIEEPDPIKAAVGIPFFWNAQEAASAGFGVMLAGQGADELFGGYRRYVTEYMDKGDAAARRTMFHDVAVIHESNIERDEKICSSYDVELRLPFASLGIAEFAMILPTELKFECKLDSLRKLVLRRTAEKAGVPKEVAQKPKKAVQYSTGINNALKKIAKQHSLTIAEYIEQLFLKNKNQPKKS